MKAAFLLGRALLGGFFLYNGINHFRETEALAGYARSKHLPMPKAAVMASGALLTAGGTSLILGLKPKLGSAAIVAFLATVSPMMHDFWNAEEPSNRQNDMIHFSKNFALLGATMALGAVEEPSSVSLRRQTGRLERLRQAVSERIAA